MGTQLPFPPKWDRAPQFSDHIYCRQTAGWIKMSLDTEVNLGPGDIVMDGVTPPLFRKRGTAAQFLAHVCCGQNGWMDEDATWYRSTPRPWPHCVRQRPSFPLRKGHSSPPSFQPMSIVATVIHLSYCWALVLRLIIDILNCHCLIKVILFISDIYRVFEDNEWKQFDKWFQVELISTT